VLAGIAGTYHGWRVLNAYHLHTGDALLGGLLAAGATALGALPLWFCQTLSGELQDSLLGFGAGVMLAASALSLVMPAIAAAGNLVMGPWTAGLVVVGAILLGTAAVLVLDKKVPHEHFINSREGTEPRTLRGAWLLFSPLHCITCPRAW